MRPQGQEEHSLRASVAAALAEIAALVLSLSAPCACEQQRTHDASVSAASAKPPAAITTTPLDEISSLGLQLTDRQQAIDVRVGAAVRLKKLAGQGRADLVGAQLDGAKLEESYFYSANFSNANLKAAKLSNSNFFGATLKNADLTDAVLVNTDLRGVDATGANLTRADLSGAILYGADLSETRLDGARFQGTRITGANLSTAQLAGADLSGALYTTKLHGNPTRFPPGFQPEQHGMVECPGDFRCSAPVPDARPRPNAP